MNPLAQIPTLVLPDGSVMTESAAILIHLGLAHPESGLLPADAHRAQMLRGLVYIAANCYAAIGIIDYPERWCSDADEDDRKRINAGTRQRLALPVGRVRRHVSGAALPHAASVSARSIFSRPSCRNGRAHASILQPRVPRSARSLAQDRKRSARRADLRASLAGLNLWKRCIR